MAMDFRPQNDPFGQIQMPTGRGQVDPGLTEFIQRVNEAKRAAALQQQQAAAMLALKKEEVAGRLSEQKQQDTAAMERTSADNASRERAAALSAGKGAIAAEDFNRLVGEEAFAPGTMVTSQMRLAWNAGDRKKQISPDAATKIGNMESGIGAIGLMREILNKSGGRTARTRAVMGSAPVIGGLATFGSKDAQDLRNAALEAADVLTRARTGAALNEHEQKVYGSLFLNILDEPEAVERVLSRYEKLFADTKANLEHGRRLPKESKAKFLSGLEAELRSAAKGGSSPVATDQRAQLAEEVRAGRMTPEEAAIKAKGLRQGADGR